MLLLEAFLKFASIGLMSMMFTLLVRDGRDVAARRFALPLIITLICMLLTTGNELLRITGPLAIPLRVIDTFSSLFIWWFGLALFDDEFELGPVEWSVAALVVCISVPVKLYYMGIIDLWFPAIEFGAALLSAGMMLHLAYRALVGRREDLIERRRRMRLWFVIAIALVLLVSILSEQTAIFMQWQSENTIWVTYVFTLPIVVWAVLWLTRLHPEALAFQERTVEVVTPLKIDPRDAESHQRLVRVMESERGFAEHGLTIGLLADKIGMPAHQLRQLINRSMGYQNFSAFMNHYRIKDVQRALADPKNSRTPVLTLAMDAGFSSLAPFNRAFKKAVGMTPSEYRTNLLDNTSKKTV